MTGTLKLLRVQFAHSSYDKQQTITTIFAEPSFYLTKLNLYIFIFDQDCGGTIPSAPSGTLGTARKTADKMSNEKSYFLKL